MSPQAVLVPPLLINNESWHVPVLKMKISQTMINLKDCQLKILERSIKNDSSHKHYRASNFSSEKCQYARKSGSKQYNRT
eukprot:8661177-Ditylum_brightwellii.AAC.1